MKRLVPIVLLVVIAGIVLVRRGGRVALALPQDVKILSVYCAGNPEITTIQNMGLLPVSLNGFAINSIASGSSGASASTSSVFYPLPPGLAMNPGQTVTFYSGPAAAPITITPPYTLTRVYIYNHALARTGTEGAVLTFNAQVVSSAACAEAQIKTVITPSPTPQATATSAPATVSTSTAVASPSATASASATPFAGASSTTSPALTPTVSGSETPTPSSTPASTAATPASTGAPVTVDYAPGWNLVGGPGGTVFAAAEELLRPSTDGSGYVTADPQQPVVAGIGYWAYFPADATNSHVTLAPATLPTLTLNVDSGVWSLVGNPSERRVLVSGADAVETYDPVNGYQAVTDLAPGQGALVFSYTGNPIVLSAEASPAGVTPANGSLATATPAVTPSEPATATPSNSPTPFPTAMIQQAAVPARSLLTSARPSR